MSLRFCILACALALCVIHGAPTSGSHHEVEKRFVLGGTGGWDYLTVEPKTDRLMISRSDRVLVVDVRDGALVATIPDTQGVHGIAQAPARGEGFTSNGRANSVTVFDLGTPEAKATIDVEGRNPDAILYDPASNHVYTFNGASEDGSAIDPQRRWVIANIPAGGKPEFAATDAAGRISSTSRISRSSG